MRSYVMPSCVYNTDKASSSVDLTAVMQCAPLSKAWEAALGHLGVI